MTMMPPSRAASRFFPPLESADEDGLLLIGGDLTPAWLLDAYRNGIFPWPIFDDPELTAWWSPDPRAIFELDQFHISRRLAQTWRSGKFQVTCDRAFSGVLRGCASAQDRLGNTWLTDDLIAAYERLFELGVAHSVEAWYEGRLAGGTYGIALGGLFTAESMFYSVRDASKVVLASLHAHLVSRGYSLWDIQQLTPHTQRFGAREISRREYVERLSNAVTEPVTFGDELEMP
jgi:leucyl/phenylalanyl-tRNA---protein transferase